MRFNIQRPADLISVEEAAELMKCIPRNIRFHITKGNLTKYSNGRGYLFVSRSEVEELKKRLYKKYAERYL